MKYKSINSYKTILFDCDGVLINSNKFKYNLFLKYASKILSFNEYSIFIESKEMNFGISRFKKFQKIFELSNISDRKIQKKIINSFNNEVYEKYLSCDTVNNLQKIYNKKSNWFVISGSKQSELRKILKVKKLDKYFKGIYGSPKNKQEIFNLISTFGIEKPILFIGDSRYDYITAKENKLDFLYVYGWSMKKDLEFFSKINQVSKIKSLDELV